MTGEELWHLALKKIEEKVAKPSFETWFIRTHYKDMTENELYIAVQNEFQKDWLESQYTELVNDVLMGLSEGNRKVSYLITSDDFNKTPEKFAPKSRSLAADLYDNDELLQMIKRLEKRVEMLEKEAYEKVREEQ